MLMTLSLGRAMKGCPLYALPQGVWNRIIAFSFKPGMDSYLVQTMEGPPSGSSGSFAVVARKRPMMTFEKKAGEYDCVSVSSGGLITTHDGRVELEGLQASSLTMTHRSYRFDRCFSETATNRDVYVDTLKPLVDHVMSRDGGATFLCHGQTGTGKTFTTRGMQELAARDIFSRAKGGVRTVDPAVLTDSKRARAVLANLRPGQVAIRVEFFELFQKSVRDLLAERKTIQLLNDGRDRVHARGAAVVVALSAQGLLDAIERGNQLRAAEPTERNPESSRSHSVLRLHIYVGTRQTADGKTRRTRDDTLQHMNQVVNPDPLTSGAAGTLTLVDLAGSERNYETFFHTAAQHKQFALINQSLMALKACFRAYHARQLLGHTDNSNTGFEDDEQERKRDGPNRHVHMPYHASTLTHLLRESFLSESHRTVVLATVSPTSTDVEHSRETLHHVACMRGADYTGVAAAIKDQVEDVQALAAAQHTPVMAKWSLEQCGSFLSTAQAEYRMLGSGKDEDVGSADEIIQLPKSINGKKLARMSSAAVTHLLCGGSRRLGQWLYKRIRQELTRLREEDRQRRRQRARIDGKRPGRTRASPRVRTPRHVDEAKSRAGFGAAREGKNRGGAAAERKVRFSNSGRGGGSHGPPRTPPARQRPPRQLYSTVRG